MQRYLNKCLPKDLSDIVLSYINDPPSFYLIGYDGMYKLDLLIEFQMFSNIQEIVDNLDKYQFFGDIVYDICGAEGEKLLWMEKFNEALKSKNIEKIFKSIDGLYIEYSLSMLGGTGEVLRRCRLINDLVGAIVSKHHKEIII